MSRPKFVSKNSKGDSYVCTVSKGSNGKDSLTCVSAQASMKVESSHSSSHSHSSEERGWPFHSKTIQAERDAFDEHHISVQSAPNMQVLWNFSQFTDAHGLHKVGDITATPTTQGDYMYFGDWPAPVAPTAPHVEDGRVYCLNRHTGQLIWQRRVVDILGITAFTGMIARTSIAIHGSSIVFATQRVRPHLFFNPKFGAYVICLDAKTGTTKWITAAPIDPMALPHDPPPPGIDSRSGLPYPALELGCEYVFTGSPIIYEKHVYIGLSGWSELLVFQPHFRHSFRGRMMCLSLSTGIIEWQTYTIDAGIRNAYNETGEERDRQRYAGNSVWTAPCIDEETQTLYFTTGNNHSAPQSRMNKFANYELQFPEPGNYLDSLVAVDIRTGKIKWSYSMANGFTDAWQVFCLAGVDSPVGDCANGPDVDFGAGPMIFKSRGRWLVGAGSKSGAFLSMDLETGQFVSKVTLGPLAGSIGGIHWGTATEDGMVFAAYCNSRLERKALATTEQNGRLASIDPILGLVNWYIQDPVPDTFDGAGVLNNFGSARVGTMSYNAPPVVANGVVFFGCADNIGHLFALNAKTGQILWSTTTGATIYGGGSIVDGVLYWGNGYTSFGGTLGKGMTAYSP